MNRNTKILIGAASFLILALVLFFFFTRKKTPISSPGNSGSGQAVQSTLPSSQPAGSIGNSSSQTSSSQNQATVDANNPPALPGKKTDTPEILDKYGKFAFETFQKYPELVDQIKILDKNFAPSQMDPSYPSHVYRSDSGKDFLLLGGCTEHNCGGTRIIVIYNVIDNKVYMGKENSTGTQLQFFGNPGDHEKSIMINFYLQK